MGTEMIAYIEYDDTPDRWREFYPDPKVEVPPPFAEASGEAQSLTSAGGIYTGSKDYLFFGAIAGVRNATGIPPLFPPRGLPRNPSRQVLDEASAEGELYDHGTRWLLFSEVNAALEHQKVDRSLLSFETHTILMILGNLASRLGDDRVRLVFGFG